MARSLLHILCLWSSSWPGFSVRPSCLTSVRSCGVRTTCGYHWPRGTSECWQVWLCHCPGHLKCPVQGPGTPCHQGQKSWKDLQSSLLYNSNVQYISTRYFCHYHNNYININSICYIYFCEHWCRFKLIQIVFHYFSMHIIFQLSTSFGQCFTFEKRQDKPHLAPESPTHKNH